MPAESGASVDCDHRIATIEVRLTDEVMQVCTPSIRRDDMRDWFAVSSFGMWFFDDTSLMEIPYDVTAFATCGWECTFLYGASAPKQFLRNNRDLQPRCPHCIGRVEDAKH
jgi:hypothetical protein